VDATLFAAATRVTVCNGRKASFWLSSWLDGQAPPIMCPLFYNHSKRKNRSVREALVDGAWVSDIAFDLTPELLHEYFKLWRAIEAEDIYLADSDEEDDKIIWTLESSGEYTARTAYLIQFEGQTRSNFPNLIWKAWANFSSACFCKTDFGHRNVYS